MFRGGSSWGNKEEEEKERNHQLIRKGNYLVIHVHLSEWPLLKTIECTNDLCSSSAVNDILNKVKLNFIL